MRTLREPRVSVSADDTDQSDPVAEQRRTIHFDHEAQDVLAVQEDRRGIGERQLPGRDGPQRRGGVEDERVPTGTGEKTHTGALAAFRIVHREGDLLAEGRAADPGLCAVGVAGVGEHAVEDELLRTDVVERGSHRVAAQRERPDPKTVDQPVGQTTVGRGEREGVDDQDEMAGFSGLGKA